MGYQELDELGEKIQNIIDSAIDENNYKKLSQTISQTVEKARQSYTNYRTGGPYTDYRQGRTWNVNSNEQNSAGSQKKGNFAGGGSFAAPHNGAYSRDSGNSGSDQAASVRQNPIQLYGTTTGTKIQGILMTVFGGTITGIMGTGFLISILGMGIAGLTTGSGSVFAVSSAFLGAATAAGGILLGAGCSRLAGLKRLKKYIQALGTHTYCNFQQLSLAVGKPVKYVKKDIKKMIMKGWFLEGHVDQQETCLITSNETYRQYVETQNQLKLRDAQQKKQNEEKQKVEKKITPEVQQVLDKGNEFLEKIHRSNEAIPGVEISRKISRIELIVQKIFDRAKEHPEIIPDLNRLMDYYLPMTVKLLNAYEDMDSQPIQGENITASKREIEETLDTLNVAFEKLLDSVFEDITLDLSSDISVLHTVLAQEGLTEDDITRREK